MLCVCLGFQPALSKVKMQDMDTDTDTSMHGQDDRITQENTIDSTEHLSKSFYPPDPRCLPRFYVHTTHFPPFPHRHHQP